MKTRTKLFQIAPDFTPRMPESCLGLALSAVQAVPFFWPSGSEDFVLSSPALSAQRFAEAGSVYVVDDDEALTELYVILLEANGYRVTAFHDRAEALAALENDSRRPDLLIMDYLGHLMPLDQFVHRSLAAHPSLRILMASGLSPTEVWFSSVRRGRFIQKPFTGDELVKEVKAALAA
jgi:CheY-like chemotaxis protein